MKTLLSIFMLMIFSLTGYTQKNTKQDSKVYTVVDINPQFSGGEEAMGKYLSMNLHVPSNSKDTGILSRAFVQFIVEKDGSLSHFIVLKGSKVIGDEIIKIMMRSPKWKPGLLYNKEVRVLFTMAPFICQAE